MKSKYKIVFLGNAGVGKTTLISQYVYKDSDSKYHPTIGIDFISTIINIGNKSVKLQLWDTAGQERFNSIIPTYTRNAFIAIIVFDLSNRNSFDNVDKWINDSVLVHSKNDGYETKLVIVGNKMDLNRVISKEEALVKAKQFNAVYVETSAMDYESIEQMTSVISEFVSESVNSESKVVDIDSIAIEVTTKKKCCRMF
ncbi:GTP-binding protein YPT6 [Dictyocoela muelleri]|nr:GTP-binding protein YPT6 [Dictyocoela muelleri]